MCEWCAWCCTIIVCAVEYACCDRKVRTAQNVLLNNWSNYVNPTQQPLRRRVLKTVVKLNSPVRVKHPAKRCAFKNIERQIVINLLSLRKESTQKLTKGTESIPSFAAHSLSSNRNTRFYIRLNCPSTSCSVASDNLHFITHLLTVLLCI